MKEKIWFTYKARIQAHKRLEWMHFHSQCILVWYAVLAAVLAIVTLRHSSVLGTDTDVYAAILAVMLLAVSLSVANRDFRGRAMLMRRNYLDLQELYNSLQDLPQVDTDALGRYNRLLGEAENHSGVDDILARIFSKGLTSRIPSRGEWAVGAGWMALRFLVTLLLYASPVWIALCSVVN